MPFFLPGMIVPQVHVLTPLLPVSVAMPLPQEASPSTVPGTGLCPKPEDPMPVPAFLSTEALLRSANVTCLNHLFPASPS